ncbi:MAG: M28 family peptidase [Cytophagales bacterium]|nr:M28 family peptidase [Bernardetiaceae bacterium]MDW8205685.1 M28 family peptidase [Cytophagales bacterium]
MNDILRFATGWFKLPALGVWLCIIAACQEQPKEMPQNTTKLILHPTPEFNADSAYTFVEQQVALGPRVPNTEPHRKAAEMFLSAFRRFGWEVQAQDFEAIAYNGTILKSRNIIASYNPQAKRRILLAAHWDTRPYADMDEDKSRRREAIDGANDGGSGVGVLLEIARVIGKQQDSLKISHIGIDIILFDSEDYGQPQDEEQVAFKKDSWCLGSQHWAKNKHREGYTAYYGILLDMVGAKDARFLLEGHSMEYAPSVVKKVWDTAHQLGFGKYFVYEATNSLIDDHLYVNQLAGIPMIDIIQYEKGSFGSFWHTHRDKMDIISKETLYAVGKTVLQVLYNEDAAIAEQ